MRYRWSGDEELILTAETPEERTWLRCVYGIAVEHELSRIRALEMAKVPA